MFSGGQTADLHSGWMALERNMGGLVTDRWKTERAEKWVDVVTVCGNSFLIGLVLSVSH